jgi:hypothetical protein
MAAPALGNRAAPDSRHTNSRTREPPMRRISCLASLLAAATIVFGLAHPILAQQSADDAGFTPIFDGKTLAGWEGDPKYWRVEDEAIVGEVTPETLLEKNTFLIWRAGTTHDFELKVEFRITSEGNSGVQYRSTQVDDAPFALRGYQADIDGANRYTGLNYEERGRAFLAPRGSINRIPPGGKTVAIGSTGDAAELAKLIKADDWNQYHIIVQGNVMVHMINGRVMSVAVDDDPEGRRAEGLLGVQVHVGPPMKVEFRNVLLKQSDAEN